MHRNPFPAHHHWALYLMTLVSSFPSSVGYTIDSRPAHNDRIGSIQIMASVNATVREHVTSSPIIFLLMRWQDVTMLACIDKAPILRVSVKHSTDNTHLGDIIIKYCMAVTRGRAIKTQLQHLTECVSSSFWLVLHQSVTSFQSYAPTDH